jgi:hypothetical protein
MRILTILAIQVVLLFSKEEVNPYKEMDSLIRIFENIEKTRTFKSQMLYSKKELAGLNDITEATEPLVMPLRDITKISIHVGKKKTIIFPPHTRILQAPTYPSSQAVTKKDFNSFDIAPSDELIGGEITVRYSVNNDIRQIRVMKITLEKYENTRNGKKVYYPIVQYTLREDINFTFGQLLEAYNKLTGDYPDGSVFFNYKGVGVGLIEDDINGVNNFGNKRYRIVKQ